jgi:ribosomal protein S6--L-glutamate ligase
MRLCFIVEECYRGDSMPLAVVRQLVAWGHSVDVFEPGRTIARISELVREGNYDAWVLKTVSGGPGLSVLEAVAASGLTTINDANAIRLVRDKAVAAAIARRAGLASPLTYFAAAPTLLRQVPPEHYPLVVKPVGGNSGRAVHLVRKPAELRSLARSLAGQGFLIAQPYVSNPGVDVKVYSVAGELHATIRRSPLHPGVPVRGGTTALTSELSRIAAAVGEVFGLDLYGVDLVEGPDGWVLVDVNDFPSFQRVPNAVAGVARSILRLAASDRAHRTAGAALVPSGSAEGGGPANWRSLVPAADEPEVGWPL